MDDLCKNVGRGVDTLDDEISKMRGLLLTNVVTRVVTKRLLPSTLPVDR